MASFIAKQLVGDQLKSVKGAVGDGEEKKEDGPTEEEQLEHQEALREEEERRKEKHRKMEEEREKIRQATRDKYGLKKKEPEPTMVADPSLDGRLGRKKKTPQEMAAESAAADEAADSPFPKDLTDLKGKVSDLSGKVMTSVTEASEKCTMQ